MSEDEELVRLWRVAAFSGDVPEKAGEAAGALLAMAARLQVLGRSKDALATYDELLYRFARNTALRAEVATALEEMVATLRRTGRPIKPRPRPSTTWPAT